MALGVDLYANKNGYMGKRRVQRCSGSDLRDKMEERTRSGGLIVTDRRDGGLKDGVSTTPPLPHKGLGMETFHVVYLVNTRIAILALAWT